MDYLLPDAVSPQYHRDNSITETAKYRQHATQVMPFQTCIIFVLLQNTQKYYFTEKKNYP